MGGGNGKRREKKKNKKEKMKTEVKNWERNIGSFLRILMSYKIYVIYSFTLLCDSKPCYARVTYMCVLCALINVLENSGLMLLSWNFGFCASTHNMMTNAPASL